MSHRQTITIVIPTHNRYSQLKNLLRSIADHWTDRIQSVVVVDDSAQPMQLGSEFQQINLSHIVLKGRVFISQAKNIGWRSTESDFVYFIDDDNEIDDSTISPLLQVISSSDRIGGLMPAVLYKARPDLVWVYATPFSKKRLKHQLIGRNVPRNSNLENKLLQTDALPNASIIRRTALEDIGGFDERLVVNSSMDLCLRLKAKKWKVFSYTGGFVYHNVEPPGKLGWWAVHGAADPERVRYEIRDWFIIMQRVEGKRHLFGIRAILQSRFVVPNILAYLTRGKSRKRLINRLFTGYLEGLRLTLRRESSLYPLRGQE